MANYTISEKTKKISVAGKLTDIEKDIISMYISNGYSVVQKSNKRVTEADILKYFDKKKDDEGKKAFLAEKDKKITDKNGKQRKAGYLVALKWFKGKYPKAMEEIKKGK